MLVCLAVRMAMDGQVCNQFCEGHREYPLPGTPSRIVDSNGGVSEFHLFNRLSKPIS